MLCSRVLIQTKGDGAQSCLLPTLHIPRSSRSPFLSLLSSARKDKTALQFDGTTTHRTAKPQKQLPKPPDCEQVRHETLATIHALANSSGSSAPHSPPQEPCTAAPSVPAHSHTQKTQTRLTLSLNAAISPLALSKAVLTTSFPFLSPTNCLSVLTAAFCACSIKSTAEAIVLGRSVPPAVVGEPCEVEGVRRAAGVEKRLACSLWKGESGSTWMAANSE